ncbi:RNA-binding cell elongation regulator Jag/EloR [Sporosarcina saromensis]|uniref:RNA-binding protein KhpB n=1 Tax=Sporosarcina saromensis TaxID=359365 RepID=A0ABU4GBH3_9BACL|nr:RNA-binding cell elongation regulator Jag/EloR [Sporosarcina saromensis]MDW0114349.1 RNA-binding cell elongation regulator Jag/EloR [Sporosarcina saromensis]
MNKITRKGATVDAAIEAALQELGLTREQVNVEVIESGKKGFLGFGAKDAEVIVTVNEPHVEDNNETDTDEKVTIVEPEQLEVEQPIEERFEEEIVLEVQDSSKVSDEVAIHETKSYVVAIANEMGIDDLVVNYEQDGKYITFQLESEKAAFLIGKRGQTLNALQQLAQLITNKFSEQFKVVRLDVGDYRERREQSLEQFAERMADQAVRNGRKVKLEPMPSYERKIIHNALSNRLDIETYSEGTDPNRYLVIEPMN